MSSYHYDDNSGVPFTLEDSNMLTIRISKERDFYKGLLLAEYTAEELEEMFSSYMKLKATR